METNWNKLAQEIHQANVAKGFWDQELTNSHCIMLVITEVSECVEAWRKGKRADVDKYISAIGDSRCGESEYQISFKSYIKDTVEDEMADIVIRLLDLAGARQVLIEERTCYHQMEKISFIENAYMCCAGLSRINILELNYIISQMIAYVYKWAKTENIDLDWHIEQKLRYNVTRPYKHGKSC